MEEGEMLLSEKQEKMLEELCITNGINYDKLRDGSGKQVNRLEMFFSGFPEIVGMSYFPNLVMLCIMGQDTLDKIRGLESLFHLEELWICEANIQEICGLDNCGKLKRLHLYDNAISKINNLSKLKLLEVLWLNDNMIESIEGLDGLLNLKEINFSNNKISQIGNSLEKIATLEILHISGNQIRSLKDLNNLIQLQRLHTLSLKDPVYGSNPVATVCNYSTYIFYHLPNIKRLDGYDVDNESIKDLAMATVRKKKMYYNMRVKTLERNMSHLLKQVEDERNRLKESPCVRIRNLSKILKTLERELEDASTSQSSNRNEASTEIEEHLQQESYKQLVQAKLGNFRDRIRELESIHDEIDQCYVESREQVENISRSTIKRLFLELETGGNVRFEDGTTNDVWYTSCHDLVLSRFCAGDFKAYDITGIKIHRITRIHNRVLRVAFDEKVFAFLAKNNETDCVDRKDMYENSIEYLFTSWTTGLNCKHGFLRLLERGCGEVAKNGESGILLSNNVFNSDCKRLELSEQQAEEEGDLCPYRHGQLVIAKVFVGDPELAKKNESKSTFNSGKANSTPGPCTISDETTDYQFRTSTKFSDPSCDCHTKQSDWVVYDSDLVLPEYIVDFEYLTKLKPLSPLISYYGMTSHDDASTDDVSDPDSDILDMEPLMQPKPRLLELTEDILLKHCSVESTKNITILSLHDCGLNRLKNINHLASLRKLVVSFNKLTKLDDITSMPHLCSLDASFNSLTTLDGLKACPVLTGLDVSWNNLKHIRDEISNLRKRLTSLTSLNTRHNPWHRGENYRLYTIGRLRTLQVLDGQFINEQEHALALRQAASSRITSFTILAHSRTDDERLRSLSLASTATVMWKYSKNKPLGLNEDDTNWMKNVTTLHLDGQGISKLSNLEKLTSLRWASLSENNISKIEGLEMCSMLEELNLSRNCILKTDGLSKLTNLKRLDLAYNDITSLEVDTMECLTSLEYLSVEDNSIGSLQGLKKCTSLQEIFSGNNQVSNTREIFYLKGLQNLDILDLSGNPTETNDNHRLFVIYHLSFLKALNGVAVTSTERSCAKETLGGRMTMDFVAERLGHANFAELQEIDLPYCDLRAIDVGNGEVFRNLRSINLEHNNLTSFGGLIHLANLKVLCLNYNKIECVFPKRKTASPNNKKGPPVVHSSDDVTSPQSFTPVLERLEVLHLGYNGISNLKALQLSRIPNIKALFLQGNEISKVEGIQGLQELRELVLDQNKIKTLSETSFIGQRRLQELHIEDNRLRDLSNFEPLFKLQRLYLGMNKIQELSELQKLERMTNLFEISLISNPITRRLMHRPILVYRQPNILCIDGIPVTNDERAKAEVYLIDHQLTSVVNPEAVETNLPTLQAKPQAPLKVTTVQLSTTTESGWSIGQRFGQVEYVESLNPHGRYNERNDPRGKLRASNSYPPQHIPSSYDVTRRGHHQASTSSSVHLGKPPAQLPNAGSYILRGNSNSNFPQPPKPK